MIRTVYDDVNAAAQNGADLNDNVTNLGHQFVDQILSNRGIEGEVYAALSNKGEQLNQAIADFTGRATGNFESVHGLASTMEAGSDDTQATLSNMATDIL